MNPSNIELFNNLSSMEGFDTNATGSTMIMSLSNEGCYDHHHNQTHLPMAFNDAIPRFRGPPNDLIFDPLSHFYHSNPMIEPQIMVNSSPSASGARNKQKKKRATAREMEKPREVVHVRAKRGQATDSHSLAERLRRGKINERLRCLQDLVPGCYKTMGMAIMLDVIINYVKSLQNQIDFLSMKLSAASLYYDFNSSEAEAIETLQGSTGYEAAGMDQKLVGEGYDNGGISQFQTSWNSL